MIIFSVVEFMSSVNTNAVFSLSFPVAICLRELPVNSFSWLGKDAEVATQEATFKLTAG